MFDKICPVCNKTFILKTISEYNKRIFCSKQCYGYGRSIENVIVRCAYCNKEEIIRVSRAKTYKCCSLECIAAFNKIRYLRPVYLNCVVCDKEFVTKKSHADKRKTCGDKQCISTWFSSIRIGTDNPKYRNGNYVGKGKSVKRDMSYVKIVKDYFNVEHLPENTHIHHIDSDENNNAIENLSLLNNKDHSWLHSECSYVLLRLFSKNKISKEEILLESRNSERLNFLLDTNIIKQTSVVYKSDELLENPEKEIIDENN